MLDLQHEVRSACEMIEGYIPERDERHHYFASWVQGSLDATWFGTAKVYDRERYSIQAYLCPQCGKLELYALIPHSGH